MPRITNQGLINSLRKCAAGDDCKYCAFADCHSSDCIRKLTSTAANRIEELLAKKERTKCKD